MSEEKQKITIIYHKEDNDGVCSAAIVKCFLERYGDRVGVDNPVYGYIGTNYAELSRMWEEHTMAVPGVTTEMSRLLDNNMVFMVDLSFNETEAMEYLFNHLKGDFFWCDHHKSAIDTSKTWDPDEDCNGIRKTSQSALLNTWDFMCYWMKVSAAPSDYIRMLSDYDSWAWSRMERYEKKEDKEYLFNFNVGVTCKSGLKVAWFDRWISSYMDYNGGVNFHEALAADCAAYGKIVRDHNMENVTKAIRDHGDKTWTVNGDRKACVVFTTEHFNSTSFEELKGADIVNGASFKYNSATGNWTIGLYNVNDDDEFHCGEYLKAKYNGGGHKGAAGCTVSEEQMIQMLKTRQI